MRKQKGLIIDPDLMGLAGAIFFGTVVMGIGFWRDVSGSEIAFRAGLTFVVAYAVVFLFARYILHVAVQLLVQQKLEEQAALERAAALLAAAEHQAAELEQNESEDSE